MRWSKPIPIYNIKSDTKYLDYDGPGVYILVLQHKNGRRYPIPRFRKPDKKGCIYIGKTANVKRYIGILRKALQMSWKQAHEKGTNHSGLYNFRSLRQKKRWFKKKVSRDTVFFEFRKCKLDKIKEIEEWNIKWYIGEYGEPPLFNAVIPKR